MEGSAERALFLFQTKIKKSNDEITRQNNIDSLMLMYDERIKYFDAEKYYVMGRKGADVLKHGDLEDAFELLEKSVIAQGNKSEPHVLWYYFESVILLYSEKIKTIDDILEKYSEIKKIGRIISLNFENILKIDIDCSFDREL